MDTFQTDTSAYGYTPPSNSGTILRNVGLRYGLMAGLLMVAWQVVIYMIDWKSATGIWGSISLLPWIMLLYFGAVEGRKALGGYIALPQALALVLIIVLVSSLMSVAYNYLQNTVIDPELPAKMKEHVIETQENMFTDMGMDEDKIDVAMSETRKADFSPSFKNLSIYMAGSVILGLVVGLIIALIVRRKPPLFPTA